MNRRQKLELATHLTVITAYVGLAHVMAAENVAHVLLAAGDHVSPPLLVLAALLVLLRLWVVLVLPGLVAARLGLLVVRQLRDRKLKN